jgi:hypothetical protein
MEKEICICAAIKYKDKIWRGHRHGDCIKAGMEEMSFNHTRKEIIGMNLFEEQGFMTSENRYVTREEGRKLQEEAGIKSADPEGYRGKTLFSEDLY